MTDNRTTEMRSLLKERGVGYEPTRFSTLQTTFTANGVEWIVTENEATGELFVEPRHGLTPEQAVVATLGSGTLTAEQVREAIEEAEAELLESCEYVGDMGQRKGDVLKAFGKLKRAIEAWNVRAQPTLF